MVRTLPLEALDFSAFVRPGDMVTWGQAAGEPMSLTARLMEQRHAIGPFRAFVGMTYSTIADATYADKVNFTAYCGTGENRQLASAGVLDILPCHYSELPIYLPGMIDVLLLQVAEGPGFNLSVAHEYLLPLLKSVRVVIAEVNEKAPWTCGGTVLNESEIDILVRTSRPLPELPSIVPNPTELAIARRVSDLIENGSTLQMGLGTLPKAILGHLERHVDLGVHSGVIGDEVADLMAAGVITNARKTIDTGCSVAGLLLGSRTLYDFAHRNPSISMRATSYTHNLSVLSRIDRFVAINSAIEVDLTGQVNAEMAKGTYVGAVGGAVDFLRGARSSRGGLPIIALPSTVGRGEQAASRIVSELSGPVSTARSDAGIIVTEHGIADLRGLTLTQRVRRMIDIVEPRFREQLERDAYTRRLTF
jgi:acyl-CoA hydrolase